MKNIILIFLIALCACKTEKNIIGNFRCENSGLGMGLKLDTNNNGILTISYNRKRFSDSIKWEMKNEFLILRNIDSNYFFIIDTNKAYSIPSKALYAKKHLLFSIDNIFFVFYKVEKNAKYKEKYQDEFYYTNKRISGEESKVIKKYFGDSIKIINLLKY